MTYRCRIDVDAVYHDVTDISLTVGSLADHLLTTPTTASQSSGTVGTAAITISGTTPLSTLVVKNAGSGTLRLAGAIDVSAGRVAVLPTTATITVSAPGGGGTYSCLWIG